MQVPSDGWYVGGLVDAETGELTGQAMALDPSRLTTHGVILGMTGSGKTGFGITLLEEALLGGVPVLAIDPKGDLGNLALRFPGLEPADFAPWVPAGTDPQDVAATWRDGLARWGISPERLRAFREAAEVVVLTPGSTSGVAVNVLGSLRAPSGDFEAQAEPLRAEIAGLVAGLLTVAGVDADPIASPEHTLLQTIVERSWRHGRDLDLTTLIKQVIDPPLRKLGVFDVDEFFPPDDRRALALRLNAVVASPSFAPWLQGVPIDVETLLWTPQGMPRATVMALSHLDDHQRQLAVTLVLSRLVSWMQRQHGSSDLRVLVYVDEVLGFAPPTAAPPSKEPILRIMKQARAFGVGMVLATQNPVDLDYKAMSNAGTWVIGRLQTERDKARVLEGLSSATGATDLAAVDQAISALSPRRFVLRSAHEDAPRRLESRWAMSYLAGPMTAEQIRRVTAQQPAPQAPAAESHVGADLPDDVTPVAPAVADDVLVRHLDPAAPWADEVGADPRGRVLDAALAARVTMRFDDRASGLDTTQEWEAVWFPLTDPLDPGTAREVDHDDRDLRTAAPEGAVYRLPTAPIDTPAWFRDVERSLTRHLHASRTVKVYRNRHLKLYSRVGEGRETFATRCDDAAQARADAETAALVTRMRARQSQLEKALRTAQQRLDQLDVDLSSRQSQELVAGAGSVLTAVLGGLGSSRSIARRTGGLLRGAASRRSTTVRTAQRRETAAARVADAMDDLGDLERALADEIAEIEARWTQAAADIEDVPVGLEANDIAVSQLALVWVPRG